LRVHKKSMFQIVNSQFGGLFVRDRAQMPCNFDPAFVRAINHGWWVSA